jgi:hypothetical protein
MDIGWWRWAVSFYLLPITILRTPFEKKNGGSGQKKQFIA